MATNDARSCSWPRPRAAHVRFWEKNCVHDVAGSYVLCGCLLCGFMYGLRPRLAPRGVAYAGSESCPRATLKTSFGAPSLTGSQTRSGACMATRARCREDCGPDAMSGLGRIGGADLPGYLCMRSPGWRFPGWVELLSSPLQRHARLPCRRIRRAALGTCNLCPFYARGAHACWNGAKAAHHARLCVCERECVLCV